MWYVHEPEIIPEWVPCDPPDEDDWDEVCQEKLAWDYQCKLELAYERLHWRREKNQPRLCSCALGFVPHF